VNEERIMTMTSGGRERPEPDPALRALAARVAPAPSFVAQTRVKLLASARARGRRRVAGAFGLAAGVAVAAVAAVVATGTFSDHLPPRFAAPVADEAGGRVALVATPASTATTPDPADCRISPLTGDELVALAETPTAVTPGYESGSPADATTAAAIKATAYEYVACQNADDLARQLALHTDEGIRRTMAPFLGDLYEWTPDPTALDGPFTPLPAADRTGLLAVDDVRVLPNGRVTAVVTIGSLNEPAILRTWYLFVERSGRYLIDAPLTSQILYADDPPWAASVDCLTASATPAPEAGNAAAPFHRTHEIRGDISVTLRSGPSRTDADVIRELPPGTPLQSLRQRSRGANPEEDGAWLWMRTEDGGQGWVREMDLVGCAP
jgi:hypothetical protein